ncbi:ABC transporter ATP-binding protein [Microbaculum sp. FT89]|uniref:ABC transporter ATP-binding protein n=1 Tax=Microbaculum sp. FT89 TaxID=3447298 RepID=UPI003F53C70C
MSESQNTSAAGSASDRPDFGRVSISDLGKVYDPEGANVVALEHCDLEFAPGDFVAIVGPSGCGKSTLLNILAGFDTPTSGTVTVDGTLLAAADKPPKPGPDRVVVFQQGALFPWKTVIENVTYGLLKQRNVGVSEARERAMSLLAKAGGLDRIADAYPGQLSSGMQRRVEILRALINNPRMLLLDEPFRAMDTVNKARMHQHLLDIFAADRKTILFITHDLEEALFLADRVVVMTTRPGTVRLDIVIDLPRPRTREMMLSDEYIRLKQQTIEAVHEEARKAFERGEREMA